MNGRSFPDADRADAGRVLTAYDNHDNGQFSVNGQRAAANYWMVDGVGRECWHRHALCFLPERYRRAVPTVSVPRRHEQPGSVEAIAEVSNSDVPLTRQSLDGRRRTGLDRDPFRREPIPCHGIQLLPQRRPSMPMIGFADRNRIAKAARAANDFGGVLGGPLVGIAPSFLFLRGPCDCGCQQVGQQAFPTWLRPKRDGRDAAFSQGLSPANSGRSG
jgi:hypothetical protein